MWKVTGIEIHTFIRHKGSSIGWRNDVVCAAILVQLAIIYDGLLRSGI